MGTRRSLGMLRTMVRWCTGSTCTTMMVSARWPCVAPALPNCACCCLVRPARVSLPSTRKLQALLTQMGSTFRRQFGPWHCWPVGIFVELNSLSKWWIAPMAKPDPAASRNERTPATTRKAFLARRLGALVAAARFGLDDDSAIRLGQTAYREAGRCSGAYERDRVESF